MMNIDNKHELQPTIGENIPGPMMERIAQVQRALSRIENALSSLEQASLVRETPMTKPEQAPKVDGPYAEPASILDKKQDISEVSASENGVADEDRARRLVDEALRGFADAA